MWGTEAGAAAGSALRGSCLSPPRGNDVTPGERAGVWSRAWDLLHPRVSVASGPEEGGESSVGWERRKGHIREDPELEVIRTDSQSPGSREGAESLSGLPGPQALPRVGDQITPHLVWVGKELTAASVFSTANISLPSQRRCGILSEKGHTGSPKLLAPVHRPQSTSHPRPS